jgi:hypothetical protein
MVHVAKSCAFDCLKGWERGRQATRNDDQVSINFIMS